MVTNKFIIKIMLALFGNLANGIQENETFSVGGEIAGLIAEYIDSERSTVQYGDLDTINKFIEKELSFRPLSNEEKSRIKENLLNYLVYNLGQFTRNYTQTVKRAADNKRRYAPGEGSIPPVLLSGVSKGVPPLAHDFACKV